jgi:hypothetical protein
VSRLEEGPRLERLSEGNGPVTRFADPYTRHGSDPMTRGTGWHLGWRQE